MRSTPSPAQPAQACHADAPIRVFLADDHAVTLWGLQQLIDGMQPRMTVVGTAASSQELLAHPALAGTDVLLLDLGLRDCNAIGLVHHLVETEGVKVVLLTGDLDPAHHRDAVLRGARGVVLKSQPAEHVLEAIESVHRGKTWLDGALMSMLLGGSGSAAAERRGDDSPSRIAALTPRERDVVDAVVEHRGAKSLVVAESLGMSECTLRNHLTVVYSKLHVRGRLELYAYAVEHGLAPRHAVAAPWAEPGWAS